MLYAMVSFLSFVIRHFFMENPCELLLNQYLNLTFYGFNVLNAELANYALDSIISPIVFFTVGLFYKRKYPVVGSILYFVFYIVLSMIIIEFSKLLLSFKVTLNLIALAYILFIFIVYILKKIIERICYKY